MIELTITLNKRNEYVIKHDNERVMSDTSFKAVFMYCVGYVESIFGDVRGLEAVRISDAAITKAARVGANIKYLRLYAVTRSAA